LLNDLAQRCKARGSFRDPLDLDRHLSIVEEKKRLLSRYATLINKPVEPFNATVFEILWARDRCGQEIATHRDRMGQVILPVVVKYTQVQFTQVEQFLAVYAQHLVEILAPGKFVDGHPWAWIEKPLVFEEEERVLENLDEFVEIIRQAEEYCEADKKAKGGAKAAKGAPAKGKATKKTTSAKNAPKAKKAPASEEKPKDIRGGSKTAQVVAMLQRKNGAALSEIMEEMGWQKHTVRGFMAGAMKKAGYAVESFKPEGGERFYRINA
jgi:hypothetical protein